MPKYVQGVFKKEHRNRFLCTVDIDGKETLCYVPSSCRLSNFLDLEGKEVILTPVVSKDARTEYSVYALRSGKNYTLLNMGQANKVIEEAIKGRRFAFLGKRENVKKEYTIDGYKSDLYIEDTKTIIEVKSFLAFNTHTSFPTVFSQRAVDQLKRIEELLSVGYNACYVFISLYPGVRRLTINDAMPEYKTRFRECIEKGMCVKGYSLMLSDFKPVINLPIKVDA